MLDLILHNFLMPGLIGMRISQDSNAWLVDQRPILDYYAFRIIDRARRDREGHADS